MIESTEAAETAAAIHADALGRVPVRVRIVLARRRMAVKRLMELKAGSELYLDRRVGEPVELLIGDRLFGYGELVNIDGEQVGVSLTEIARAA